MSLSSWTMTFLSLLALFPKYSASVNVLLSYSGTLQQEVLYSSYLFLKSNLMEFEKKRSNVATVNVVWCEDYL